MTRAPEVFVRLRGKIPSTPTCKELNPLALVITTIQMQTLRNGFLIRGGIGYGSHIELNEENNFYVISKALVYAAAVEKKIKHPCVALHESVVVPAKLWEASLQVPPIARALLHFEGISLVSPLNIMWGTSAIGIAKSLLKQHPGHKEKYEWFLRLCNAIFQHERLVPET